MKKTKNTKYILAIETSCDETAAAVLSVEHSKEPVRRSLGEGGWPKIKTLSSVVKSQIELHSKMGGVVPEVAARAHVKNIGPVVEKTLNDAEVNLSNVNYIAPTVGPGLAPSLIVGVEFAKALSLASDNPIIPVNHMLGHLYSPFGSALIHGRMSADLFPIISIIVSGGHTILVLMKTTKDYKVLGQTVDDAAGEAFDKVAKLLGLPYPGGPEVSKLAIRGNPQAINFPRPMINDKTYNFSFSGLKTAVLYYIRDNPPVSFPRRRESRNIDSGSLSASLRGVRNDTADICASFQDAAVDVLVTKTLRAAKKFGAKSISLSGGVAANNLLRSELNLKSKILNLKFFMPPIGLCTDNAEMIGLAAAFMLYNGYKPKSYKQIKADSNLQL